MKLTKGEVEHIAKLANLKLSSSEVAKFRTQLSQVLSYIDKLQEVDTKGVRATSQVTGLKNIFREDKVEKSLTQKEALSNAKKTYKGYFVTARII
jgi:aspartyl-tRNA(Asn)/glutamyl-tRNA(Gln) amidotransferase subunit C